MSVIAFFNGVYCNAESVVGKVSEIVGGRPISDEDVVAHAAERFDMPESKLVRAFSSKTSVFNEFTREKECSIACLRLSLACLMESGPAVVHGYCGLLVPASIGHVLRACLIADMPYRMRLAREQGVSEKEALNKIRTEDAERAAWTRALYSVGDPWDASLYDMVVPVNKTGVEGAIALIAENSNKEAVKRTMASEAAERDFKLAATVDVELARAGHDVSASARDGFVTLTINKHVLMLSRLEEDLKTIAEKIPGVKSVEVRVGKDSRHSRIYRKHGSEIPSKVLLVDDEREFVQTLSERLELRDVGSAVAYDGESALNIVEEDEPEVMVIDLKMPGIDGIEVLKRVKRSRPEIEVIVLTGHGSDKDRKQCLELGAFAYLQKPVNIDEIGDTLKKAYEKIKKT